MPVFVLLVLALRKEALALFVTAALLVVHTAQEVQLLAGVDLKVVLGFEIARDQRQILPRAQGHALPTPAARHAFHALPAFLNGFFARPKQPRTLRMRHAFHGFNALTRFNLQVFARRSLQSATGLHLSSPRTQVFIRLQP